MKKIQDNKNLQSAGLNGVLLMGGYCISGGIMAGDSASYIINWLGAVLVSAFIWLGAASVLPNEKQVWKPRIYTSCSLSL